MVEEVKEVSVKPTHPSKEEKETKKKVPSNYTCSSIAAADQSVQQKVPKMGENGLVGQSVKNCTTLSPDTSKDVSSETSMQSNTAPAPTEQKPKPIPPPEKVL